MNIGRWGWKRGEDGNRTEGEREWNRRGEGREQKRGEEERRKIKEEE